MGTFIDHHQVADLRIAIDPPKHPRLFFYSRVLPTLSRRITGLFR
jgi:hypothetical protein